MQVRAAMAGTYGAAHVLARFGAKPVAIVANDATKAALAHLPIAALRLSGDHVVGLPRMGFDGIGELASQPRAPLALRFGPEPGRRLDQALGRIFEPTSPIRDDDLIEVRRAFVEPISTAHYIGLLVIELVHCWTSSAWVPLFCLRRSLLRVA
jgi:protein ImuB